MKLLLNTVFKFTARQRAVLQAIRPDLELVEQNAAVEIMVTEQVPRNLAALAKNFHRFQQGATLLNPVSHRLSYQSPGPLPS